MLMYRAYTSKAHILETCRDTARDDRGFITALDDDDLTQLVNEAKVAGCTELGGLLHARFLQLIE